MSKPVSSGQCLCGSIQFVVSGSPVFSVLCYCQDCQRISGGGHLPQAAFPTRQVEITGTPDIYEWTSDAGNRLQLGYCSDCGSPLYKTTSKLPDILFIAVGLLNDQSLFCEPNLAFAGSCREWDYSAKNV